MDLGSSSVRALVIDQAGRVVWASTSGNIEAAWLGATDSVDPETLWQETCRLVRSASNAVGRIDGIGVTAQLSLVVVDSELRPVCGLMPWSDWRAHDEAAMLSARLPGVELVAGRWVTPELTAPRLVWLRDRHPELYERVTTAMTLKDFIVARFTGRVVTDSTSASYSLLYDVRKRVWSAELLAVCEINPGLLPPTLEAGDLAGSVNEDAAAHTGLDRGIPVAVGAPDGTLGAVGAGAVDPGVTVDVAGTTDTLFRSVASPAIPGGSVVLNAFIQPDLWTAGGPTGMTGGALSWIAWLAGLTSVDELYRSWDAEIDRVPAGAEGLVFVTTLTGERFPSWRTKRVGGIEGLRAHHSIAHLARAAEEGAACLVAAGLAFFGERW